MVDEDPGVVAVRGSDVSMVEMGVEVERPLDFTTGVGDGVVSAAVAVTGGVEIERGWKLS